MHYFISDLCLVCLSLFGWIQALSAQSGHCRAMGQGGGGGGLVRHRWVAIRRSAGAPRVAAKRASPHVGLDPSVWGLPDAPHQNGHPSGGLRRGPLSSLYR